MTKAHVYFSLSRNYYKSKNGRVRTFEAIVITDRQIYKFKGFFRSGDNKLFVSEVVKLQGVRRIPSAFYFVADFDKVMVFLKNQLEILSNKFDQEEAAQATKQVYNRRK